MSRVGPLAWCYVLVLPVILPPRRCNGRGVQQLFAMAIIAVETRYKDVSYACECVSTDHTGFT